MDAILRAYPWDTGVVVIADEPPGDATPATAAADTEDGSVGRRHPVSSDSCTSTIFRCTVVDVDEAEAEAEEAAVVVDGCWMVKRSARMDAAISGSSGAMSLARKRRRACGRVYHFKSVSSAPAIPPAEGRKV